MSARLSPGAVLRAGCPTIAPLSERWRDVLLLVVLAAVALLALALRVPNLATPNNNYDEGVYLQSLLLMRHGYRPFSEIIATQGPLHLYLAYPSYAVGGYTLSAARAGSVVASLAGLGGVAWAAYALGGRVGGAGAALALAIGPTYLVASRTALPEAPAVALAALAVGAAAWAHRTDHNGWRLLAGVLLALACLVKPIAAPAAIPVVLLASTRRSRRAALLAPAAAAALGVAGLAAVGTSGALDQVIGWRLGARQLDPSLPVIRDNAELLIDTMFRQEQPAFYALAAVGGLALARRSPRAGPALVGWLGAQLALLLAYANLSSHLGTFLVAPLAVLAGLGLAAGWSAVSSGRWRTAAVLAMPVALWYAASIPALLERDQRLIAGRVSSGREDGRDEGAVVRAIAELTAPDDFVLTDAPHLAFLADRKVPPPLVDPSNARIRAGALTAEHVITGLHVYRPEIVVLWTGKLARLQSFMETLTRELELVSAHGMADGGLPRAIYRDPDEDAD